MLPKYNGGLKSKIFRALRWQYALNLGIGGLAAIYTIMIARTLGAYEFGVYAIVTAVPTLVFNLFDLRLQETIIYFHSQVGRMESISSRTAGSLFTIDVAARLAGLLLALAVGPIVNRTMSLAVPFPVVAFAALSLLVTKVGSGPSMGLLRVGERLNIFATLQIVDWLVRLLMLTVLSATKTLSLQNLLLTQCGSGALFNFFIVRAASRQFFREFAERLAFSVRDSVITLRTHWGILGANQTISVMDSVVKEADTLVVGYALSVEASGLYKMAKNFATIAWRAADPVYIAIMPTLAELWATGRTVELSGFVKKLTIVLLAVSVVLYGLSCFGVIAAVRLFLGPAYATTAAIFPLASLWIVIAMPLIWSHSLAIATGASALQARASVIGNFTGLTALYLGSRWFGLPGSAMGLSIAFALPFVLATIFLLRARIVSWSR